MGAVECMKDLARMCENDCPLPVKCDECNSWIMQHPAEALRIVEKWSKAHTIQTRKDKFKEVFGITVWESIDEGHGDWSSWWDAPYEAPKGETNVEIG